MVRRLVSVFQRVLLVSFSIWIAMIAFVLWRFPYGAIRDRDGNLHDKRGVAVTQADYDGAKIWERCYVACAIVVVGSGVSCWALQRYGRRSESPQT